MFGLKENNFDAAALEKFRQHQRTSFSVLEEVGASLKEGESEKEVARRIHKQMKLAGAQGLFHGPVALFGERTSYPGDFGKYGALPTQRRLAKNEAVILDCGPIFDGFTVDTSYAMRFGKGGVPKELDAALAEFRAAVLDGVKQGLTMSEIAKRIDRKIKEKGLENCHKKHILMVLGHNVTQEKNAFLRGKAALRGPLPRELWGVSPRQAAFIVTQTVLAARGLPRRSPNWNHTPVCNHPVPDGLWAIEPHVAKNGIGAKFEDLLLVQNGDVRYLDDDLPHTRRWRKAGIMKSSIR